jgi:hypothetical protein
MPVDGVVVAALREEAAVELQASIADPRQHVERAVEPDPVVATSQQLGAIRSAAAARH